MSYFVIEINEDRDALIHRFDDKASLLKFLESEQDRFKPDGFFNDGSFAHGQYADLRASSGTFIIKGDIVVPRPKEVVDID